MDSSQTLKAAWDTRLVPRLPEPKRSTKVGLDGGVGRERSERVRVPASLYLCLSVRCGVVC